MGDAKHVGRPLTWLQWTQLQGLYHLLSETERRSQALVDEAAKILAPAMTSDHYEGDTLVELARERLESGAYSRESLEQALAGDGIVVEPAPALTVEFPTPAPTSADPWEVLRTIREMANTAEPVESPINRLAGVYEEARLALGEPDAEG
jgi:hypothetical protein